MQENQSNDEPSWTQIEPFLDDSMRELNDSDREALVLRYFERCELKSVGATLGISEEAARKRVHRAVAKLREVLVRRGAVVSEKALSVLLGGMLATSAPVGMAATLAQTALATSSVIAGGTFLKIMAISKLKPVGVAAVILLAGGTAVFQAFDNRSLRLQLADSKRQMADLESARNFDQARLAALPNDSELALLQADHLEAIRLRALAAKLQLELKGRPDPAALTNLTAGLSKEEDSYWVRKFTTKVDAKVRSGDALLSGGWETAPGKRSFVIITPTPIDAVGNRTSDPHANQVTIESIWVEAENRVLPQLGLDHFKADSDESGKSEIYSEADAMTLLDRVRNTSGVDLLNIPKVTTLSGREARLSVEDSFTPPNGHHLVTGPMVDVVPTLSETDGSIHLAVNAEMNLKRPEHSPTEPVEK